MGRYLPQCSAVGGSAWMTARMLLCTMLALPLPSSRIASPLAPHSPASVTAPVPIAVPAAVPPAPPDLGGRLRRQ
jgi:hypothetical protein